MCFSKILKEKPPMVQIPYEFKLSDEFESNCDYVELESRDELTSKTGSLTLI